MKNNEDLEKQLEELKKTQKRIETLRDNLYKGSKEYEEEKKRKSQRSWLMYFSFTLLVIGTWIIIYHLGWWVALGLWFLRINQNIGLLKLIGGKHSALEMWNKDNDKLKD